jgi:hypothetical protein
VPNPRAFVAFERRCQKGEIDMVHLDQLQTAVGHPHIVIPYNYADHEFASKLTAALRHDRITQWIDDIDMSAGVLLVSRIAHAARPVDCVVPVVSAASVASSWVQHDLKTVMARSFVGRHVRVLPARIDDSALPDFLASQPYFDFHRNGWSVAYDDLILAVHQHMGSRIPKPSQTGFRLPRPLRLS